MVDVEKLRRELAESRSAQQDYRLVAALPDVLTELEQLRAGMQAIVDENLSYSNDDQRHMCDICGMYSPVGESGRRVR